MDSKRILQVLACKKKTLTYRYLRIGSLGKESKLKKIILILFIFEFLIVFLVNLIS